MFRNLRKKADAPKQKPIPEGVAPQQTCLEAFQSHWNQVLQVIKRPSPDSVRQCTLDNVHSVISIVEKMSSLLAEEREENNQQGLCLCYALSEEIMEKLVSWCLVCGTYEIKVKFEMLKIFENLISQSHQPLLYHKPVIRPLLTLLSSCVTVQNSDVETCVIALLHQLCVCISQNPQYLELFFNVSLNSGQENFVIFCLLIPYIHYQGALGQQARDALLLIMAASSRNQVIGRYIANNSDFCPVLAAGLSALYSSLPHKVRPEGEEDWYRIEKLDYLHMPDVQMIINCLEFCNAVVQVAHSLVSEQLIRYIYNGFLIPVMAPALLQSSLEDQVSAIAYLDLFIRTITEPALLRAFLRFILTVRHDEVIILDWLIERISSSTKLSMVSLSIFKTLVELNCEDVMFSLCFRYLYQLTHVMPSQRYTIKEVDIYSRTAEKLLALQPACCLQELSEEQARSVVVHDNGYSVSEYDLLSNQSFKVGHRLGRPSVPRCPDVEHPPPKLEEYQTPYLDYLLEAHHMVRSCAKACSCWCFRYDGEDPPPNALVEELPFGNSTLTRVPSYRKYDTPHHALDDDVPLLTLSTDSDAPLFLAVDDTARPVENQDPDNNSTRLIDIVDAPSSIPPSNTSSQSIMHNISADTNVSTSATTLQPLPVISPIDLQSNTMHNSVSTCISFNECSPIDSFLAYLDKSIEPVTYDPKKSSFTIFEEIDAAIKLAEERHRTQAILMETQSLSLSAVSSGSQIVLDSKLRSDSAEADLAKLRSRSTEKPKSHSLRLADSCDLSPNLGLFITTVLAKLENMMNNTLSVNLLLTGLLTRICCYPQHLLRSFLLNHNLVLQPSVKSLTQVLSSVKQKVDAYSNTVPGFNALVLQARIILCDTIETIEIDLSNTGRRRSATLQPSPSKLQRETHLHGGKRPGIADFFRRDKQSKSVPQLELIRESNGFRFTHSNESLPLESPQDRLATMNAKKAVFCALVLEEFVKELAALSQEHAVLMDEGYQTD